MSAGSIPIPITWVSVYERPFGSDDMLTGLYLVRNTSNKTMACIEVRSAMWGSPIDFDEYAFIGPVAMEYKLLH